MEESTKDFDDVFILRLQDTIRRIKDSREMEERFMLLKEVLKEERREGRPEGKAEGILLLLKELGTVPDELAEKIMSEKDSAVLNEYLKCAAKVASIEDFARKFV